MRVYLAAPWCDRELARDAAATFERAGFTITERWWEHPDVPNYPLNCTAAEHDELGDQAVKDFIGVVTAHALILLNTGKSEGKAVETGVAIAGNKPIILVGERSNIFHFLPCVQQVADVAAAIELLTT